MAFIITIIFLSPASWLVWLIYSNKDCYGILGDILEVQEARDVAREEYRAKLSQLENGTIDMEEYRLGYSSWLRIENKLASDAAGLYSGARNRQCL
jgi:hypothetical protein